MYLIVLNMIEAILISWFFSSLLFVERKKTYQLIVFVFNFVVITIVNMIDLYDLYLSTFLVVMNTLISYYFDDNDFGETLFVVCLESMYYCVVNLITLIIIQFCPQLDPPYSSKFLYLFFGIFLLRYMQKNPLYFIKSLYYQISFVFFTMHFVIDYLTIIYIEYENKYTELIISFVLLTICVIILMLMILKVSNLSKSELSLKVLKQEQSNMKSIYSLYDEIKITKHDMKHEYQLLNSYIENKDYEKIREMVSVKQNEIFHIPTLIHSSYEVIDTIVNQKIIMAHERNISFQTKIAIDGALSMNEIDLNNLLGNVLDNAVENCCDNGSIEFILMKDKQVLHIIVTNSIKEITDFKTKKDRKEHGYGLLSVRRIVRKYHGKCLIEQENSKIKFDITLLLM